MSLRLRVRVRVRRRILAVPSKHALCNDFKRHVTLISANHHRMSNRQATSIIRRLLSTLSNTTMSGLLCSILLSVYCILKSHSSWLLVQGVAKVRSSNFMHSNFWPKLYIDITFLEDVYFSIEYMYSEFQYWHAFFIFLSHSVAVVAWSGIQRVDPQTIHFELFCHPVRRSQFNPQTIFV